MNENPFMFGIFLQCTYKGCFRWQPSAICGWFCSPVPRFYFISWSLPCFRRVSKSVMAFRVAFDLRVCLGISLPTSLPDHRFGHLFNCLCFCLWTKVFPIYPPVWQRIEEVASKTNNEFPHIEMRKQHRCTRSWDLEVLWTLRHAARTPHTSKRFGGERDQRGDQSVLRSATRLPIAVTYRNPRQKPTPLHSLTHILLKRFNLQSVDVSVYLTLWHRLWLLSQALWERAVGNIVFLGKYL